MHPMTCLIIDDEAPAREELVFLLSRLEGVSILGEADTPRTAIQKIKTLEPDLIFLDIQMPGGSGFDVVAELQDMDRPPLVVFATAFDQYAIQAFVENALDYILKPFEEHRVAAAVQRAEDRLRLRHTNPSGDYSAMLSALSSVHRLHKIPVEHKGHIRLIDPKDVVYMAARDKQTLVRCTSTDFIAHGNPSLDTLETRFVHAGFFRPHRSFLINLDHVREFYPWFNGRYELVMDSDAGDKVPVSKSRVKAFKELIGL